MARRIVQTINRKESMNLKVDEGYKRRAINR